MSAWVVPVVFRGVICLHMVTGFVVGPILGCILVVVHWDQDMLLGVAHVRPGVASKLGVPLFLRVSALRLALVHMSFPMMSG